MKGDFSRDTFDRKKRYSGVLMQQGRVQLDADWNEQLSIHAHRTHTEAVDVIGQHGAPRGDDGFRVDLLGAAADLTLSKGRIYVGGLLCELEESAPVPARLTTFGNDRLSVEQLDSGGGAFEPGQWVEVSAAGRAHTQLRRVHRVSDSPRMLTLTENLTGFNAAEDLFVRRVVTYTTQPDHPSPPHTAFGSGGAASPPDLSPPALSPPTSPPASPPGGGSPVTSPPADGDGHRQLDLRPGQYIVYLHAWQRHVTALDDPRIRETALGGPDTTTRVKNVWQVNLLPVAGTGGDCATEFEEWEKLIAPATGQMNARVQPVEDDEDPCTLPPSAGYRRLENQLYRVEVHRGGGRERATFKWSRDNGSIQTTIERVEDDTVTVSGLGKDEVLGFTGGQWVEIVDDESELGSSQTEPRPLLRISGQPDHERGEITLSGSVAHLAGRRGLKLRRWDQAGASFGEGIAMTAADTAPDSAGWISLEGGVQVFFSAGLYRAGDYWLIPARTATGDIEWPPFEPQGAEPVPQPPHGVRHHYCRLALLTVVSRSNVTVADCREVFPPLTDITARDVSVDTSRCPDLVSARNVQDAIDVLCANRQGGCTQVAIPGRGWEEVFDRVGAGQDAQICFQAGEYPLSAAVRVRGKGHLKLTGVGRGTRILAPDAEAALVFDNCPSVSVRDLYAETGYVGEERAGRRTDQERPLNGTLTFVNCAAVNVEQTTLKCGAGLLRSSACITVRGDVKDIVAARIRNCELSVGHRQQGVLLVNVARALVEGNAVSVYEKPSRIRVTSEVEDPRLRAALHDILITRATFVPVPPAGRTNVTLKVPGLPPLPAAPAPPPEGSVIHFKTHSSLRKDWELLLTANPLRSDRFTQRALLAHVKRLADRMIADEGFRANFQNFRDLFLRLQQQDRAVASQGVTVGGQVARQVRVINNSIEGVLEGVHVGLSLSEHDARGNPVRNKFDIAGEVTVAGNSILVVLPPDAVKASRNGVFVGNCQSLRVENNDIRLERIADAADIEIEGIRVWGVLGDRLSVSRNDLRPAVMGDKTKFDSGIVIQPHPTTPPIILQTLPPRCWLAVENHIECVKIPRVKAPDNVIRRENFPA